MEKKLEADFKKNRSEIEEHTERVNQKQNSKLKELDKLREKSHYDQNKIDLKNKMSELNSNGIVLDKQINETKSQLVRNLDVRDSLENTQKIRLNYSDKPLNTVDLIERDELMIDVARVDLEEVKAKGDQSYQLIEEEFENSRIIMQSELLQNDAEYVQLKHDIEKSSLKELDLKKLLRDSSFENDEEKSKIENELA